MGCACGKSKDPTKKYQKGEGKSKKENQDQTQNNGKDLTPDLKGKTPDGLKNNDPSSGNNNNKQGKQENNNEKWDGADQGKGKSMKDDAKSLKGVDQDKSKIGGMEPKSGMNPTNHSYINTSMGGLDDSFKYTNTANMFEISNDDKALDEDYYLDMNENQWKVLEAAMEQAHKENKDKEIPDLQSGKAQSVQMEWAKILQKQFNQEKGTISLTENKNKLFKAYKTVLQLKERNWYEEITSLYKEKNSMSKSTSSMTGLTFDRKMIQIQEQFRWFVSAVANVKLNFNNTIGTHEFPPFRAAKAKKGLGDKQFDSSNSSLVKGYSVTDSEDDSGNQSPTRIMLQSSLIPRKSQIASLNFKTSPLDPKQAIDPELPDIFSPVWQNGFVWKGVYFKLYSKREGLKLKKEMKVMKHLGVECLQTETSVKLDVNLGNINESVDTTKYINNQFVNIILPLMCIAESSSWVLFGTPVFPIKKAASEDQTSRLAQDASQIFKSSFLLNNLSAKNFKIYYRPEEPSNNYSSYSSIPHQSHYLLLSNVSKIAIQLPKVDIFFTLNQESNAHVTFLDYPKRGLIDADLVKKVLGYAKYDISTHALLKKDPKQDNKPLYFDIMKFKRRGWLIQMIYVVAKETFPSNFTKNRRAMEFLSHSEKKRNKEIRGNVLICATLSNKETIVHPYFISDQLATHSFLDEPLEPNDLKSTKPNYPKNKYSESIAQQNLKVSFKFNRIDKIFIEYFYTNLSKSIEAIVDTLENTDSIINFNSLKELFHRKGVNMRLEWIVYIKLKRERSKVLVGADILARCLKKMISEKTSKRMARFKKQAPLGYFEASAMKEKFDELLLEKNEFLIENLFKKLLCQALNILVRGTPEGPDNEDLFYAELTTDLFLHRMRILDMCKRLIDHQSFDGFLSSETITNVINIACLHAGVFFDAVEYHMKVGIAYEVKRQVRNDKYVFWVSTYGQAIKPQDINVIFASETYLSIKERCYLLLLKLLPSFPQNNSVPIELVVPSSLYKLRKNIKFDDGQSPGFECFLREYYELPDLEILNDWGVLLESVLNGLYATDGEQTFLIEANIIQLVLAYFGENDGDNQHSLSILERINSFVTNSPVCSPELTIAIHTWFGIFSESKLFVECEQSYTVGLLALHKLYGDPRGRGALGTPWELFITWRLSILSRLQGKIHDAEYAEELYDATIMTLIDNPLSDHFKEHPIYRDPLRDYTGQKDQSFKFPEKMDLKTMRGKEHPFPYWTNNLVFDENVSKIETINNTLQRTPQLLKWMITHIPTSQKTGVLWDTAYLRDFYLGIMQNSFSNTASVSSLSGISLDRKDKSSVTGGDGQSTPKSAMLKSDKKKDRLQGGNLVQMFEKDSSTLNKRELNGIVFSWGQNNEGQVGTPIGHVKEEDLPNKRMRIYHPKSIVALKDSVIISVSCGHTHSMAITLTHTLLAWGSNKSWQLGLGESAPSQVYVPTPVFGIEDVSQVSCGSEHTVALTGSGLVYSWGQGEGGLLGHGDTQNKSKPTIIEGLREMHIASVVCGGLHTIALTKTGVCYSWGRGEGGQLGVSFDQLTHDMANNELYLTIPKRVRGAIEGINIIQIACGDAHSLALAQNGAVYGWGYTSNGQLGLGVSSDNYTPSSPYGLQIKEPVLIERLMNTKITDIFAGSLFSLFLNDKKELYGCGLNDYNQLGLEKVIAKYQQNQLDQYKQIQSGRNNESAVPKKIDCFTNMPILNVACGENHSLSLVFYDSYYMLFSWGMQRHGQLGLGDTQLPQSIPRPISFLQYVRIYSMACGAFHSLVVLGEASKAFRKVIFKIKLNQKDLLIERLEKKAENKWSSIAFEVKQTYEDMIDSALNNLDNIIPSEEGKIDNPKAMKKGN